jgi:hypothetical protein
MSGPRTVMIVAKVPPGADAEDVVMFAVDALTSWGGQLHPDDPLFGSLTLKSISAGGRSYQLTPDGRDLVVAEPKVSTPPLGSS